MSTCPLFVHSLHQNPVVNCNPWCLLQKWMRQNMETKDDDSVGITAAKMSSKDRQQCLYRTAENIWQPYFYLASEVHVINTRPPLRVVLLWREVTASQSHWYWVHLETLTGNSTCDWVEALQTKGRGFYSGSFIDGDTTATVHTAELALLIWHPWQRLLHLYCGRSISK